MSSRVQLLLAVSLTALAVLVSPQLTAVIGQEFYYTPPSPPGVPTRAYVAPSEPASLAEYYSNMAAPGTSLSPAAQVPTVPLPITSPAVNDRLGKLEKRLDEVDAAKSKLPNATINGAFQADAVFFNQTDELRDQFGSIESGAGFRRTRLSAKGAVSETMNYFVQMDFAFFGRPTFTDVWVEQTKVPLLGTVRAGQWKQPFGLEAVSSYRYTTFMERSSLFQTFVPFRHIGIGFYNNSEDLNTTWAASYFRTGQDQFGNSLSTDGGNGVACA